VSIMLISLEDAKTFLEIDNSSYDTLLTNLIVFVSDRIQTFLNRKLKKEERTQYFQAGRRRYYLSAYPVDITSTITVVVGEETKTEDEDYYIWDDIGVVEFREPTTYVGPKQVAVTYTGGYNATTITVSGSVQEIYLSTIPDSLKYACLLQVAFMFRRRRDIGLNSVSMPDGSINVQSPTDLLPEVKNILKSYRKTPSEC